MLKDVLEDIYKEKVKPKDGDIPTDLYEATVELFEKATAKGMAKSKNEKIVEDKPFLKKYRHTIDVFSAFRSHAYAKQMADQLYDSKGHLLPFEEWVEKTKDIQTHFNKTWLRTEYDTAVLRAKQAADWKMFEDEQEDYPRLRWMPTSSASPREVHRVFWEAKLTLPVNDRFWDRHHPGDQWNCKCWLQQTTEKSTPIKERPSAKDYPKPADGLDSRATKEMFSRNHPYYPTKNTCIWLKLANGGVKSWLGKVVDKIECPGNCNMCDFIVIHEQYNQKKKKESFIEKTDEEKKFLKEVKDKYTSITKDWIAENCDEVKLPNSKKPSKQINLEIDGKNVVVRRRFFDETKHKCRQWDIEETMKISLEIKDWYKELKFVGTEPGNDWEDPFYVFTGKYKGHNLIAKAKSTEGLILYTLRLADIEPPK